MRIIGSHARRPGREEYLRAHTELHDGELCAKLPTGQSSGAVTSFANADALVVLAADQPRIENGDRLPVIRLADVWD
jgi:molybdopterin molybdotransferase